MPELKFNNRVVIVTGAGAGLGREYALLFASRGAKVVVNDLGGSTDGAGNSTKAADTVVQEIKSNGGEAVSDYNSVVDGHKIVETAIKNYGRIDILVNNAGILRDKSFANLSDSDWILIHDVHVRGSFKTTQAAWPYMKKQKYGRIIMTSSHSGIYGNFGQANYSSAKLAVVGLSNTLAIEGAKYNIHCNVIIPTAASRLTEGILPDILFNELKPKLIAPIVVYLCHERNEDNGVIIESAAGYAAKLHIVRGKGTVLRTSLKQNNITPEQVENAWPMVTDMTNSKRLNTISEASGSLLEVIENLENNNLQKGIQSVETEFEYGSKDLILYALGIGASLKNNGEFKYLYENDSEFCSIPTFFILPGLIGLMSSSLVADSLKHASVDLTNILHGEQYLEILGDLSTSGKLITKSEIVDIMDKKSGAVVVVNMKSYNERGDLVVMNQNTIFVMGAGNFGGKREPGKDVIKTVELPKRPTDSEIMYKTSIDQAALYRLSGDINPLHIDPNFAKIAGFHTPILHGLCSLGFSVRAVLQNYTNNDPSLFKSVKVRFSKPVLPGQTLKIEMWRNDRRIHFHTSVLETKESVIVGAYVDLKEVIPTNHFLNSKI